MCLWGIGWRGGGWRGGGRGRVWLWVWVWLWLRLRMRLRLRLRVGGCASDARCVGGLRGAGQRLRSGAFAQDLPRRPPPSSSSLSPSATAFRFPRAYRRPAPRRPPTQRTRSVAISKQRGRTGFLGSSPRGVGDGRSCGARSMPAAQAALWSLRVVVRREGVRFACGCAAWREESDCNLFLVSDCISLVATVS
ncbi:hypothetical protein LMG3441_05342 [Achromobacter kerstersii]|uniref:Uncharacterized protein n=1 Tax=Achromobacter kerstersii TaxID=1353890 RepID=A0A6S7AVL4_9BURK|nr:hypothetical protein LMG3441_05342 [Achromobacter kerstersii]